MNETEPHSAEAEQGVLGSMLISPSEAIPNCMQKIEVNHFFSPAHRTIYNVLVDLWNAGKPIDFITLTQILRDRNLLDGVGGAHFVTSLFTFVPTAANIAYCLEIICDKFALRQIIIAAAESVRLAHENEPDVSATLALATERLSAIQLNGRGSLPMMQDAAALLSDPIVLLPDVIKGVLHRGGKLVLGGASKSHKDVAAD